MNFAPVSRAREALGAPLPRFNLANSSCSDAAVAATEESPQSGVLGTLPGTCRSNAVPLSDLGLLVDVGYK